jgi:hypothetical protein
MPELTRKWRFVVPFVMILLVITTMMGVACHNHDHCTSAACSFCHLAIDTPAIASSSAGMLLAASDHILHYDPLISRVAAPAISPRAPPA